jgi:hypothetical protein
MMISLELGADFQATLASMTNAGKKIAAATSRGLRHAVEFAADHVGENFITGQLLKSRSGYLRNAVQGWKESDFEGIVGVKPGSAVEHYKWLLGSEIKTITPTHGRLLSIPMRDAKTGAGVLKDEYSVGLKNIDGGFFKELVPGKLFFVKRSGKTERSRLLVLFLMVPSVTVHGSDALAKGTLDAEDGMTQRIEDNIAKAIA